MSVQLFNKYAEQQPYHIYYSMNLINNDTANPVPPVRFKYDEVRNNPYLYAPENYFMSIVRFHIQTPTLPVFIPQIVTGQSNVNLTPYIVSLTYVYNSTTYTGNANIIYQPTDLTQTPPTDFVSPGATVSDLTAPYYYIYTYTAWVNMINTAFTSAYNSLKTQVNTAGGSLPSAYAPFMSIDPVNLTCAISADNAGYSTTLSGGTVSGNPTPIKIYFNTPLWTLYNNFQWIYQGTNAPNDLDAQLVCYNAYNTNLFTITVNSTTTYSAIQVYQEGTTASLLNPVESIVFTTSILPVQMEQVGIPLIFNSQNAYNIGLNANVSPVITDFQVPFSALNSYKPDIQYTPSGEYRLIDLNGTSPYQNINIDVKWKDIYGVFHDFYLGSGCSASMKIMFRRKDFSNAPPVNIPHSENFQPSA
jgi:hypothetical protein